MAALYANNKPVGDGVADDSPALQYAIDNCGGYLELPRGVYRVTQTLRLPSDTHLKLHPFAVLRLCGETPKKRGDFLLTNADHAHGNKNIHIEGGLWDGNNAGICNAKPPLFTPDGWSGALVNFQNVRNLVITDMTVQNPTTFFFRLGNIDGFAIRNIVLTGDNLRPNQDGFHFSGGCRNGTVRGVFALGKQTNDDLIALNADDCLERVENLDLSRDAIESIRFDGIFAENCHTLLRLLSVDNPIRNISLRNIRCGVRAYAVNMDASRYCRTPLFSEAHRPAGVGCIENIRISDMTAFSADPNEKKPLLCCESRVKNFSITRFTRDQTAENGSVRPTLVVRNVVRTAVSLQEADAVGGTARRTATGYYLTGKQDTLSVGGSFYELFLDTQV